MRNNRFFKKFAGKRQYSVRTKIIASIAIIILILGAINTAILLKSYSYCAQYDKIIVNIGSGNRLSEAVNKISPELRDIVFGKVEFENSKQNEIINQLELELSSIKKQIESKNSQRKVDIIENTVNTLKENIKKLQGQLETKQSYEEKEKTLEEINAISGIIEENIQEFILSELEYSNEIKNSIQQSLKKTFLLNVVILSLTILFSLIYAWIISGQISDPLKELCRSASLIASGNLSVQEISSSNCKEAKELSGSFYKMAESLKHIIGKIHGTNKKLNNASVILNENAKQNSTAGENISAAINNTLEGLKIQSLELESTAKTIDTMFKISREIEMSSEKILANAGQAVELAINGNKCIHNFSQQLDMLRESINDSAETTEKLNSNSEEMNNILNSISNISSQTNLLALNAAIEAARSGEAGRSFAVVADEIRKLAQESEASAKKIEKLVKTVQQEARLMKEKMIKNIEKVSEGINLGEKAKEYFNQIEEANKIVNSDINTMILELKKLNEQIANVNNTTVKINSIIDENKKAGENIYSALQQQVASQQELYASSENLRLLAKELEESIGEFCVN